MTGCSVRTTNGRPMKISAIVIPSGLNDGLDAVRLEVLPEPAGRRVEARQRDAGDGGRQRERQIDHRIDEPPAGKAVAHQHPRDDEAEDAVDERGDERSADASGGRTRRRADRDRLPEVPGSRRRTTSNGSVSSGTSTISDQVEQRERHRQAESREATLSVWHELVIGPSRRRPISCRADRSDRRSRRWRSASCSPPASRRTLHRS